MYEPRTDDHLCVRSRPLSESSRHRGKQIDALKGQETKIVVSRLVRNCGRFGSLRRSSMGTTAERTASRWGLRTTTGTGERGIGSTTALSFLSNRLHCPAFAGGTGQPRVLWRGGLCSERILRHPIEPRRTQSCSVRPSTTYSNTVGIQRHARGLSRQYRSVGISGNDSD